MEDYNGLINRSPFLAGIFLILLLSLAGVPATGGFMGKFMVFGAALAEQFYILALIAIINSVVAVGYYFKVIKAMFFVPGEGLPAISVAKPTRYALLITLAVTLLLGIFPSWFLHIATTSGLAMIGL